MNDSLFRLSLKCLIQNTEGDILVVKEAGRAFWDLPGGGMEHGEPLAVAIARELKEEVDFTGNFTFSPLTIDEPALLDRGVWQVRIILRVLPDNFNFATGIDADAVTFIDVSSFETSDRKLERKLYEYSKLI